jgi:hypothetical protein
VVGKALGSGDIRLEGGDKCVRVVTLSNYGYSMLGCLPVLSNKSPVLWSHTLTSASYDGNFIYVFHYENNFI